MIGMSSIHFNYIIKTFRRTHRKYHQKPPTYLFEIFFTLIGENWRGLFEFSEMMMYKDIMKFFEESNEEKKSHKSNKKISFDIARHSFF